MKESVTYLQSTTAWCTKCQKAEFARIIATENGVFLERVCDATGIHRSPLANSAEWYLERCMGAREVKAPTLAKEAKKGCPQDCGPCTRHTSPLQLAVFSVTNVCDLNCPICFTYNRDDANYYKSIEETTKIISEIKRQNPDIQLINITGGEPTMHPDIIGVIKAIKSMGIKRITMNSNGITISKDRELAKQLKELDVQVVLSLHTLNSETAIKIYGEDVVAEKRKALEVFEEFDIPITILPVYIKGVNDAEIPQIISTYIKKEFVKSITIQNMTFTGFYGSDFQPRIHSTIEDVEEAFINEGICKATDFFTPGSYHPLCYSASYVMVHDEFITPLSSIIDIEILKKSASSGYYLEPDASLTHAFAEGVNQMWAESDDHDRLMSLKKILRTLYPTDRNLSDEERTKAAQKFIKMIYIHPHMDEDNFDLDRVSSCCDLVPDEDGNMIPACSYNLLYRQKDERFWVEKE